MIPHGNPSFLIDKSSPKQIKTPGSWSGVFIWGQPSAAGVTPHCAGAASPRRNHSEPGLISPDCFHEILRSRSFRSMRSRYKLPGTAVSSGRCPPPLCRRVLPTTQKDPARWRGLFYSGRSRISRASAGSQWERDRTRSPHKAGELPRCHRSHRVSGRCPLPRSARQVPFRHAKRPRTAAGSFLFRQEPDQLRFCRQSMVKG